MKIRSIFLLIISIILVVVSSWNLSIFLRLDKATTQYPTDGHFDIACNMSTKYVKSGKNVSIGVLIISITLMMASSISIYKDFTRSGSSGSSGAAGRSV